MADKSDTWMPLYVGDYLRDTARLSTEAHGAYLLLIMDYWTNGPLPDDDTVLATITRLSSDAWSMHRAMLKRFFRIVDGCWEHNRIDRERAVAAEHAAKRKNKAKQAANARWGTRPDAPSNAGGNAPSMPEAKLGECPSPPQPPVVVEDRGGPRVSSDLVDLANRISAETGMIISPDRGEHFGEQIDFLRQWTEFGLTHDEIVAGVRAKVAQSPEPIFTLRYCNRAVRQMIARRELSDGKPGFSASNRRNARPASRADEMDATLERFLAASADRS